MQDIDDLKSAINFIEDEKKYYSMFHHVMESCVTARCICVALWNVSEISDVDLLSYTERINKAKKRAIEMHKTWVIKRLKQNDNHTVESIVESIYNVIFG